MRPIGNRQYDIRFSYSKFKTWVDNYNANGIVIVPFHEWWFINSNTNDMYIKDISFHNQTVTFKVITNGERGLVNINIPAEKEIRVTDIKTHEIIPWMVNVDNSITFSIQSNHEYEIFCPEIPPAFHF